MTDAFDLTGKVAVVTGGNSGIGLGFADALARAGADVSIWGRDVRRNAEAAVQLEARGHRVLPLEVDVTDEAAVVAATQEVATQLGRIDSCFANAGRPATGTGFLETSLDDFRAVTSVNLDGAFVTLREAAKQMVAQGTGGSLVVTASLAAISGVPRGQAYAATKAGVIAMTNGIAVEMARHDIRANAILPGWIESAMTEGLFSWDKFSEKVLPRVPMRRWGTGDDFGAIAVYLASDASRYHTGDAMVIDGGYSKF